MTLKTQNKASSPNESNAPPVKPPLPERGEVNADLTAPRPPTDDADPAPLSREERIRLEAYRRSEARGGAGDPTQDWLEAEAEIDKQTQR